ncbi:MAG: hypothetical protein KAK00_03365 [Nanoarchaeota archaeon]|nr:hypothetical protein [Nanoarchaeota archaeon]
MQNQPKSVKVNCSFCGKEIECPENMLEESEKHMCFECFQNPTEKMGKEDLKNVHVDMPTDEFDKTIPEAMTNSLVEEAFPEIWQERKKELREMSKKELAKEMFGAGAYIAIDNMMHSIKHESGQDSGENKK